MILLFNHKNNLNFNEIKKYEKKLRKYKIIIFPSNCYLSLFQKGNYILGAQDISRFNDKNITGEINGSQLKSLNVKYCLIGHSDRKEYLKENKDIVIKKLKECINNNIIPLCCINTENKKTIKNYIDLYLNVLDNNNAYIVFEPINNIGSINPDLNNIYDNIMYIKQYISNKYNKIIKVIYGGGVSLDNIDTLKAFRIIDGLIISTNSINIKKIEKIFFKTYN